MSDWLGLDGRRVLVAGGGGTIGGALVDGFLAAGATVAALDISDEAMSGWNEAERNVLRANIAARQPFLDFVLNRVDAAGARRKYQVSGEPMFNQSCRFIGYRGIGVELLSRH